MALPCLQMNTLTLLGHEGELMCALALTFNIPKQLLGLDKTLELLHTIDVERVRLVDSNGLRVLVRVRDENVNIRVYFSGTREECLAYAKLIHDDIEEAESFRGKTCYKYQCKLEKVVVIAATVQKVVGKAYTNKAPWESDISSHVLR